MIAKQAKHLHHVQEGGGPLISSTPATAKETSSPITNPDLHHYPQRKCGVGHQACKTTPDQDTIETKKIPKKSVDSIVEAFLDEHTEFLDDYVRRKVSRRQLEQWLFLPFAKEEKWSSWLKTTFTAGKQTSNTPNPNPRRIHCISDSNLLKTGGLLSCVRGRPASEQRQRSRSFTPLRKLSATTFEVGGLATPILATTLDGQPSFLRTTPAGSGTAHNLNQEKEQQQLNLGQQHSISNRQDLLLSIVPNTIMQANDVPTFAKALMKSANLLLGQAAQVEFVLLSLPNRLFNGTVYSMTPSSNSLVSSRQGELNNSLMTSALTSSQLLNVNDQWVGQDENKQSYLNNALVGPLFKSETGEIIGGLQLSDKASGFTPEDVQLFQTILSLASACLSTLLSQMELRLELSRSEVFLELARTVFSEPTLGLESTMLTILTNFLSLIDCERCQVSLSDRTQPLVFKRVFDLHRNDLVTAKEVLEAPYEDRLPMRSDLTGMVVQSGQKINLHGQELRTTSDEEDCLLRSFLCLPIRDPDANIVGVISLANKDVKDCLHFTSNDERFVEAFSVFCGMSIRNAADYEKAVLSEAKMQVAFEVMNYQVSANTEEATHHLAALPVPAASSLQIDSFHFSYLSLDDNATLTATIRMFIDLGLNSRFGIDHQTLCRWLLTVRRNYRNETVPYHNWYHAFNVAQMMFSMLLETQWHKTFSMTDILGLMISCISHDLDHRGTNNSFQQKMNNPLAKLYTTSTLERHHLNQCLLLLALRGNNILDNLSKDEYADTLDVIEHCILATDLALHFRHAPDISNLALQVQMEDDNMTFLEEPPNRELVQAAMMTAADLGHSTKPWEVHQHVSHLAAEEFWHQGDLERHEFNTDPPPIMDRKVALEQVQIQFLDDICLSLYKDMSRFSSALEPLLEGCLANRQRWINLKSNSQADSETGEEHARNL